MTGLTIKLPAVADASASQALRDDLLQALDGGQGCHLDLSAVERVTTPMLQVLVSAVRCFTAAGAPLVLANPSPAVHDAISASAIPLPLSEI